MAPAAASPTALTLGRLVELRDAYLRSREHSEPVEALSEAVTAVFETPDKEMVIAFLAGVQVNSAEGEDGLAFRAELVAQFEDYRRWLERSETAAASSGPEEVARSSDAVQRPWYRRPSVIVISTLFIGAAILAAVDGDTRSGSTRSGSTRATTSPSSVGQATTARVGQVARDGRFAFVVHNLFCRGARSLSRRSEYLEKEAQGQFCFLHVTVRNISDREQSLFAGNQYLLDSNGNRYKAESDASLYDERAISYSSINPGNEVEGVMIFDVPRGLRPTQAQLHDSAFSGGVLVRLPDAEPWNSKIELSD